MNWFDALDIADSFWEDATELNELCACSDRVELVDSAPAPNTFPSSFSESDLTIRDLESASTDEWTIPSFGLEDSYLEPKSKRRARWTATEDALLEKLAHKFKNDWGKIAEHFPYHPLASVQKRWRKKFDPKIKKTRWTPEEDSLIIRLFEVEGGNWIKISKSMKGRLPDSIKNRFYGTIRKRLSADEQERLAIRARSMNLDSLRSLIVPRRDIDDTLSERIAEAANESLSSLSFSTNDPSLASMDKTEKRQKIQELRERMMTLESFLSSTKMQITKIERDIE
jgi:hypothetical protein